MKNTKSYNLLITATLFLALNICSVMSHAQDLEVAGQVKIGSMNSSSNGSNVVVRQSDGTLAQRDISSILPSSSKVMTKYGLSSVPIDIKIRGRYVYLIYDETKQLEIIDVSDPKFPFSISTLILDDTPEKLQIVGSYAFIDFSDSVIRIYDISNPAQSFLVSKIDPGNNLRDIKDMKVCGQYVYMAVIPSSGDPKFLVIADISDITNPTLVGEIELINLLASGHSLYGIDVQGQYAYILHGRRIKTVDVSDPANPVLKGNTSLAGSAQRVYVSGPYAYILDYGQFRSIRIFDISDPLSHTHLYDVNSNLTFGILLLKGNYIYASDLNNDDFIEINNSNPRSVFLESNLNPGLNFIRSFDISGRYAYLVGDTPNGPELKIIDLSGGEYSALIANSLEVGGLQVRNNIVSTGKIDVDGGVNIGEGGIYSKGNASIQGNTTVWNKMGIGSNSLDRNLVVHDQSSSVIKVSADVDGGRELILGVNQSSGGWLRTETNHNLSFWTNKKQRVTIRNSGEMILSTLGTSGSTNLCLNGSSEFSKCSSSLRYKKNIEDYHISESLVDQLQPVSFVWKDSEVEDYGLIAEEVAKIDPLLVTYNEQGEVEGVKYDRIGVALIDVIKDQKKEINELKNILGEQASEVKQLKEEINELKSIMGNAFEKGRHEQYVPTQVGQQ